MWAWRNLAAILPFLPHQASSKPCWLCLENISRIQPLLGLHCNPGARASIPFAWTPADAPLKFPSFLPLLPAQHLESFEQRQWEPSFPCSGALLWLLAHSEISQGLIHLLAPGFFPDPRLPGDLPADLAYSAPSQGLPCGSSGTPLWDSQTGCGLSFQVETPAQMSPPWRGPFTSHLWGGGPSSVLGLLTVLLASQHVTRALSPHFTVASSEFHEMSSSSVCCVLCGMFIPGGVSYTLQGLRDCLLGGE